MLSHLAVKLSHCSQLLFIGGFNQFMLNLASTLFLSAIYILLSIDQIQEAIFISILLVHIFQLGIGSHHVSLVGEQYETFLSVQFQSLSQNGQHLTHTECLRHHKSTNKKQLIRVNNHGKM